MRRAMAVVVCVLLGGGAAWRLGVDFWGFWQQGGFQVALHWSTYLNAPTELRVQNSLREQYPAYVTLRSHLQEGDQVVVDVVRDAARWRELRMEVERGVRPPEGNALLFCSRLQRLFWPRRVHMAHQAGELRGPALWVALGTDREPGPEFSAVMRSAELSIWRR